MDKQVDNQVDRMRSVGNGRTLQKVFVRSRVEARKDRQRVVGRVGLDRRRQEGMEQRLSSCLNSYRSTKIPN